MELNEDQQRFTAYVLALEDAEVFRARMGVQQAEFEVRQAEHKLEGARWSLKLAEDMRDAVRQGMLAE